MPPARVANVVLCALALSAIGCAHANRPALEPKLETPKEEARGGRDEPKPEIDIDLSPTGMAAWLRAPRVAEVRARSSELEIVGGPDYHLLVGKGFVDPLGEKARIVRAYGDEFRRFLRDDATTLVYETGDPQQQRYHFFMTARAGDLAYHCRTSPDGTLSRDAIDQMLTACEGIRAEPHADLADVADR